MCDAGPVLTSGSGVARHGDRSSVG
jgi:hypothetical protein